MRISVIDSHTGGEPTRVVPEGAVPCEGASMIERLRFLRDHDEIRRGLVLEPRGSEPLVAAILMPPVSEPSTAGVIFCNKAGYLGMCGHGSVGVVETLRYLARIEGGCIWLDTPVGPVSAELAPDGEIGITNVESYRLAKDVPVLVPGFGTVSGDVAYGGNWFFIVHGSPIELDIANARELTECTLRILRALRESGITGEDGAEIDHVELTSAGRPSKNFVLCPGPAYDRSPCGTGTSAKLACLIADGKVGFGEPYVQESITGSRFRLQAKPGTRGIVPTIWARAYVTAETTLVYDDNDPLRLGIG